MPDGNGPSTTVSDLLPTHFYSIVLTSLRTILSPKVSENKACVKIVLVNKVYYGIVQEVNV